MRESICGPSSERLSRNGMPPLPYTSHKLTGAAANGGWATPMRLQRSSMRGLATPGIASPARSPLTSATNTGTPAAEKLSASPCTVMVLPVPVAPATSP